MAGFFDALKRGIQGKPVFEAPTPQAAAPIPTVDNSATTTPQPDSPIKKDDPSTFPVVQLTRTYSRENGQNLEIYSSPKNLWNDTVLLDTLRFMGTTLKLDSSLSPNQEREVRIYKGPTLTQKQASQATLTYKIHHGDHFEATYDVVYLFTPEQTYQVTDFRPRPPVRHLF
jgi:hypothetical protein